MGGPRRDDSSALHVSVFLAPGSSPDDQVLLFFLLSASGVGIRVQNLEKATELMQTPDHGVHAVNLGRHARHGVSADMTT